MSSLEAMRVLLFAGEALAASALVMLIVWLAAGQAAASRRHLSWAAGFAALLVLPLLAALAPSLVHLTVAAPVEATPAFLPLSAAHGSAHIYTAAFIPAPPAPSDAFMLDASALAKLAFGIWLIGVAAIALRGLAAAFALSRLRANSVAHRFGHLAIDGPSCELRLSTSEDDARGPMTWGLLRPVILLPGDAVNWPRERLDAVLRHELAHVARRDCLTQTLALAACALYWPNPLVWFGAKRLRREAEMAADDAVIVSGVRPSTYASALLRIANDFQAHPLPRMPLAMAAPSALEARVQSVLAATQSRTGVTMRDVVKIAGVGLVATIAMAFARPSLAEEAPAAPPAPAMMADARVAPTEPVAPPPVAEADAPVDPVAPVAPLPPLGRHGHRHVYAVTTETTSRDGKQHTVRVVRDGELTPQERQRIDAEVAKAHAAVEAARPQIERAVREARVAQRVAAAIRADRPRIEAEIMAAKQAANADVQRALVEAQVEIARAHLDARSAAVVRQALERAGRSFASSRVHIEMRDPEENDNASSDDNNDSEDSADQGDDSGDNGSDR